VRYSLASLQSPNRFTQIFPELLQILNKGFR
jgi:hypothetical protein